MTVLEQETLAAVKQAARQYTKQDIDWEQRRYETAKQVIGMLAFGMIDWQGEEKKFTIQDSCRKAVEIADELIKQLKGGWNN